MHDPKKNPALAAEVASLRERLGLYVEIPVIEGVHPLAGVPGALILCCHDTANDDTHTVSLSVDPADPNSLDDVMNEDGEIAPEMLVRITHQLAAAYN